MNIISFIQLMVMAPPEQPPLWLWIIIGILGVIALVLLAGQTGLELPKRKEKLE